MSLADLDSSEGIALHTDGSAWNKNKSGGWAWIAIDAFDGEASDSGAVRGTTNNRMEMMAWIKGLQAIHDVLGACTILVYSDSEYVGLGAMDPTRKRNCNPDLWRDLDTAMALHDYVEFCHVKGHKGHKYNERVDKLAGEARLKGSEAHATTQQDHTPRKRKPVSGRRGRGASGRSKSHSNRSSNSR